MAAATGTRIDNLMLQRCALVCAILILVWMQEDLVALLGLGQTQRLSPPFPLPPISAWRKGDATADIDLIVRTTSSDLPFLLTMLNSVEIFLLDQGVREVLVIFDEEKTDDHVGESFISAPPKKRTFRLCAPYTSSLKTNDPL
jgi:hypothetical protein